MTEESGGGIRGAAKRRWAVGGGERGRELVRGRRGSGISLRLRWGQSCDKWRRRRRRPRRLNSVGSGLSLELIGHGMTRANYEW